MCSSQIACAFLSLGFHPYKKRQSSLATERDRSRRKPVLFKADIRNIADAALLPVSSIRRPPLTEDNKAGMTD
jgi:hypothetical protein